MELKHNGKRIIAAVGQRPFTYGANTFCKLIPLFDHLNEKEKILNPLDFHNDGEIWWRLSSNTNPDSIIPGMLMEPTLEPSQEKTDDPNKSLYQARFESKENVIEQSAGAELFRPLRETAKSIMRLRGGKNGVRLPHVSARQIFLAVDGMVYGPFTTRESSIDANAPAWDYALSATVERDSRPKLYRIAESEFTARYAILREEFAKNGLQGKVWQYFTAIPDFKAVGIEDGKRTFAYPVIIRAINTTDAMSATVENVPFELLEHITDRITKEVKLVNRVLFDLTPKPCATIEWE